MDVSIIICICDEERWDDLSVAIDSVKIQTLQPKEIIIVVDHNNNLFERVRNQFDSIIVIENQMTKGASGARNTGAAVAISKIIAFLDDDAVAFPDWLEKLQTGYQNPEVLGVGGEILPLWLTARPWWFPDEFNWVIGATYKGLPVSTAKVRNLWTGNMSVKREFFDAIQGFRIGFGKVGNRSSPEDTDFCIRALQQYPQNYWIYKPEARVWHKVPKRRTSFRFFYTRCFNEGLGKAKLSNLVGTNSGLSAERTFIARTLPMGVLRGISDIILRRDIGGIGRSFAIIVGVTFSVIGYLVGVIQEFIRSPRKPDVVFRFD